MPPFSRPYAAVIRAVFGAVIAAVILTARGFLTTAPQLQPQIQQPLLPSSSRPSTAVIAAVFAAVILTVQFCDSTSITAANTADTIAFLMLC